MDGIPEPLWQRAEAAAAWLRQCKDQGRTVTVVHHIDADGVTAGAIALECLERAGISSSEIAAKSLDDLHINKIASSSAEALWFCDFGSTAYMHFEGIEKLVCDHHELVRDGHEDDFPHVNPLLDDLSGSEISGAGCAFLVAMALDPNNIDLVKMALVGATGDLQDRRGGFTGANAALLDHAQRHELAASTVEVGWFGTQTRPLRKFMALAREPAIPGITGAQAQATRLLSELGIPVAVDGRERTWSDLAEDEKIALRSALVDRLIAGGCKDITSAFRPVTQLLDEEPGTPVRELQEFGTLLNSTARYGHPEIGLQVCRGDRSEAYEKALGLLTNHRQHLVGSMNEFASRGIQTMTALQWVYVGDAVRDTVIGIVCGMALDGLGLRRDMPLLGLADTEDGRIKVSSRAPHELTGRIDLATTMRECAAHFGGQGGGHKGAAGATIPKEAMDEFLQLADATLTAQLGAVVQENHAVADSQGPWKPKSGQTRLM